MLTVVVLMLELVLVDGISVGVLFVVVVVVVVVDVVEFTFSILSILPKLGRAAAETAGTAPNLPPPLPPFLTFTVVALPPPPGVVWNWAGGVSFFCEMSASVFVISNEPLITDCVTGAPRGGGAGVLALLLPINEVVAENL